MRKRFVTTLILGIITVMCALSLTACNDETPVDVAGKTFVFVSIVGEYPETTSDEDKAMWDENFEGTNEAYKDTLNWIFAEDGTFQQTYPDVDDKDMPSGTYVQNGKVIELTWSDDPLKKTEVTVSGNNIIFKNDVTNSDGSILLTQVQTFKLLEE